MYRSRAPGRLRGGPGYNPAEIHGTRHPRSPALSLSPTPSRSIAGWRLGLPTATLAVALLLAVSAVLIARVSPEGLVVVGLALVAVMGFAAFHWPHPALVLVVVSPIVDRYLVAGLLPEKMAPIAHLFSEAVLLAVGIAFLVHAVRERRLIGALRHPTTGLLIAFVLVAALSAVVNAVPPTVAGLGVVYTLDAAVLFFLPRMVPWSMRQITVAIGVFVAIVVAAAFVALLQALLSPTLFGLYVMTGQFGEVYRLAAFIGDPNVLGAFVTAAAPFTLLAATNLESPTRRRLAIGVAFLLLLILWLTFSRGSWLSMAVSTAFVLAWFGWRTLGLAVAILLLTFVTANVMPRDLLLGGGAGGAARPNVFGSTVDRLGAVGAGQDIRWRFVTNAVPIFSEHPVLGVGPGRYGGSVAHDYETPIYEEYGTDAIFRSWPQRTVDNFWLHLIVEVGVLGTVAFVAAALVPGWRILTAGRRARGLDRVVLGGIATGTVAMAVSSVTTMLLEANSVGFLFWFLLGLGSVLVARVSRRDDPDGAST